MTRNPVFVALDTPDLVAALEIANAVKAHVGGFKVGLEFLTAQGPFGVEKIVKMGLPVFADTKFHDIPTTVAGAAREISKLGVAIFNVHASGGAAMIEAALDAASQINPRPKIIGVTVLTSMDDRDLEPIGQKGPLADQVVRLAELAKVSGLDGIVCSPREIAAVRRACGAGFLIVTPGIRPAGAAIGDQRRVHTPVDALKAGSDILVIGRPITAAADPRAAAKAIADEIASVEMA